MPRGRPKLENPKKRVAIRMDSDVLNWFKKDGPGYQTRINAELRKITGIDNG